MLPHTMASAHTKEKRKCFLIMIMFNKLLKLNIWDKVTEKYGITEI